MKNPCAEKAQGFLHLQDIIASYEAAHELHVGGLGKHVHRLDLEEGVAERAEARGVAGEGGGIARHVHDAPGAHARRGAEHVFAAPRAHRVAHDHVRAEALFVELRHEPPRVGGVKFRVGDAVLFRVFLRVFDGGGDDFDADHAAGVPREAEGNGARAAVRVDHRFLSRERREVERRLVEHFRLLGIHLKERIRRYFKREAAEGGGERLPPPEAAELRPEDDVARAALHIVVERHQLRQGVPHLPHPFRFARQVWRSRDDNRHEFPAVAHAAQDVAHAARAGLLIVRRDAVLVHERLREEEEPVIRLPLDGAGQGGDDGVGPLPVIPETRPPARAARGHGHFIPVAERLGRGQHGAHDLRGIAADLRDRAGGAHPLRAELAFVREMGNLAPSARVVHGARGLRPVRRRREKFRELRGGVGFLYERHLRAHPLAGERPRHEESEALVFPDALAVHAQIVDGKFIHAARTDGDDGRGFHAVGPSRSSASFAAARASGERPR